jgi:hypothetical protein
LPDKSAFHGWNKADYTDGNVGKKAVSQLLSKAKEMCGLIKEEITDGKF